MRHFVQALGVPLLLALGTGQGDARLTPTQDHIPAPKAAAPAPRPGQHPGTQTPSTQIAAIHIPHGPGDHIPQCYMIYGLRSGPGGMVCTDRGGVALPIPFHPQVFMGPFQERPASPLPTQPRFALPYTVTP